MSNRTKFFGWLTVFIIGWVVFGFNWSSVVWVFIITIVIGISAGAATFYWCEWTYERALEKIYKKKMEEINGKESQNQSKTRASSGSVAA